MDQIEQTMRQLLDAESKAIKNIPVSDAYSRAVALIVERVHRLGGKVVASGMGKAGHIALNIAATLSSTGTPAVFLHPTEAQHGDLGMLQPNDVLLLVCNSGRTTEILELAHNARELYPAPIPIVSITGSVDSPLTEMSEIVLFTGGAPEVCPLGFTPTTSTTLMTVIGDVLVVGLMKTINFTAADYARRHHGGCLGSAARKASGGE